jgi:mannose-6-phosphate isomerase-like protein (cupin superfamily)
LSLKGTITFTLEQINKNIKAMEIKTVNLKISLTHLLIIGSKIVAELNGQLVKSKFKDEFIMHQHENEDEMFLVIEGKLLMQLEHKTVEINAGEFVVIPKKTNHRPVAVGESRFFFLSPIQL